MKAKFKVGDKVRFIDGTVSGFFKFEIQEITTIFDAQTFSPVDMCSLKNSSFDCHIQGIVNSERLKIISKLNLKHIDYKFLTD